MYGQKAKPPMLSVGVPPNYQVPADLLAARPSQRSARKRPAQLRQMDQMAPKTDTLEDDSEIPSIDDPIRKFHTLDYKARSI